MKQKRSRSEKELRATKIALTVLKIIAGAGLLAMALCAPNAIPVLNLAKRYRRRA